LARYNCLPESEELVRLIKKASAGQYQVWEIWDDLIYMVAVELSQPLDRRENREEEYIRRGKKYDKQTIQLFPEMFLSIVNTMEKSFETGFLDILGDVYMGLELGNHWKGQFFTPYTVCRCMAKMMIEGTNIEERIKSRGYITINEPCCGAGAMIIAAADTLRSQNIINYQQDVLFVAQDIDPVCALMCYIQISLLGMSGIVMIGDTILNKYHDVWYTPLYMLNKWNSVTLLKTILKN